MSLKAVLFLAGKRAPASGVIRHRLEKELQLLVSLEKIVPDRIVTPT